MPDTQASPAANPTLAGSAMPALLNHIGLTQAGQLLICQTQQFSQQLVGVLADGG